MRYQDLYIGQAAEFAKTITERAIAIFAELTGDFNALHMDEEVAAASRFEGRIAHGMLTASLISTMIGMHLPGPGCVYLGQTLRFTRPVRIGDAVTVRAEVVELIPERLRARLATVCRNQQGETVLEGEAMVMMLEA